VENYNPGKTITRNKRAQWLYWVTCRSRTFRSEVKSAFLKYIQFRILSTSEIGVSDASFTTDVDLSSQVQTHKEAGPDFMSPEL